MIRIVKKSFTETKDGPDTKIEFYKVGRMLGRGAFGRVSLGMHKLARKLVALKCINKEYFEDERSK
jgi:serine/threonine protein kinase